MDVLVLKYCSLIGLLSCLCYFTSYFLVPIIIGKAKRWNILDIPNDRKQHQNPIPRLGGLSIMPAFWITCSFVLLFSTRLTGVLPIDFSPSFSSTILGLLIGSTGIFLLGSIDDIRRLTAYQKLIGQGLIAFFNSAFSSYSDNDFWL